MLKSTTLTTATLFLLLSVSAMAQTARVHAISGNGKVVVQREQRTDWLPVRPGTELYQGDQIFPDRKVKAYIRCPDQTQPVLARAGVPSGLNSICIRWVSRDARGSQAAETIGGLDPTIPYLIAPRHTLLLSAPPLLRWNPVAGASEYSIEVNSPTGLVWQTKTTATQLSYAGKPLQPGTPYAITIRTNTGKSSQADRRPNQSQSATALDFRILRPAEAVLVQAEAAKISAQPPTNLADALTLANFYGNYTVPEAAVLNYQLSSQTFATYSLTSEAIAVLETLPLPDQQSAKVQLALADLYWQIGLIRQAETHYLQAIAQVQGLADLEDWTGAYYGLGQLYAVIGNDEKALQAYQQARAGYIFLGETRRAEILKGRIEKLGKATSKGLRPAG
jgi:tetratricopeptide (TPR) repeat protein